MDNLFILLIKLTVIATGYSIPNPDTLPEITFDNIEVCSDHIICSEHYSVYDQSKNMIVLPKACENNLPNSVRCRATFIHEFVHFLQYTNGKYENDSCEEKYMNEQEAYKIQLQYLLKSKYPISRYNIILPVECQSYLNDLHK